MSDFKNHSDSKLCELFSKQMEIMREQIELLKRQEPARPAAYAKEESQAVPQSTGKPKIAVIGMAGRFPGAPDVEALWRNLRAGVESVTFFTDEERLAAGADAEVMKNPRYVRAGAILDGIDLVDAGLFGYSPREAEVMDPPDRIFLECAWELF